MAKYFPRSVETNAWPTNLDISMETDFPAISLSSFPVLDALYSFLFLILPVWFSKLFDYSNGFCPFFLFLFILFQSLRKTIPFWTALLLQFHPKNKEQKKMCPSPKFSFPSNSFTFMAKKKKSGKRKLFRIEVKRSILKRLRTLTRYSILFFFSFSVYPLPSPPLSYHPH